MMKKLSLWAALLCMALLLTACGTQDNRAYYEQAQLYLGCGDYGYAAELFSQLGEYEDSADYALYSRALQAIGDGEYDLARANLNAVNPFKSSGRYLMYLDAAAAEEEGEREKALSMYEKLGSFADSHLAAERLRKEIPETALQEGRSLMAKGEYAAARDIFLSLDGYGVSETYAENCTAAINKAAYTEADKLCDAGDHLAAMEAFIALGDTLDALERAEKCRSAIHTELERQLAQVTLMTAPALAEACEKLGDDEFAQKCIAELNARYGRNLDLIMMTQPCVQLGKYPGAESGEERPVLWRVVKQEGAALTLLCEHVLDAFGTAQTVPLMLSEAEAAAAGEVMLPAVTDLASLSDLTCAATPYALAQGAAVEDGKCLYWLRDSLENGLHPVINASGALMMPEEGSVPGVRPMINISLDRCTFTLGSGTPEDPFRTE